MRPSTQLSRSLRHYLGITCADPSGRQPLGDRRAISADPRLDPDTTVWASTDAGFGDQRGPESGHSSLRYVIILVCSAHTAAVLGAGIGLDPVMAECLQMWVF